MNLTEKINYWREDDVYRTKEHFALRHSDPVGAPWTDVPAAVLVGPPVDGIVNVEFLLPLNANLVRDVVREIEFYLIDKDELCPWSYAKYHCGTAANLYSKIQWSFYRPMDQQPDLSEDRTNA